MIPPQRKSNRALSIKMRDHSLAEAIDEIRQKRVQQNIDKFSRNRTDILEAIARGLKNETLDSFRAVKKDLIRGIIPDKGKKGQMQAFTIFTFGIVAFLTIVLFGGLIWVTGLLNDALVDAGALNEANAGQPGYTNLTYAANATFGKVNESIQSLRLVALTLIFSQIMVFIVINSYVRTNPALFFVYVLVVFLAVMLAAPVSNAYETILGTNIYDGILQSFTGSNWLLLNLPLVTLLMGLLGGLFMFINLARNQGERSL